MASFNKEQLEAVYASSKENILIAAGAGSGKTKTLSERVYELVERKEITPEQLLVLTFTNNAAHEMKGRILARFGNSHPDYPKMLSSHVQSFDSFNAYLLRLYASRLGVSPSFSIISDTLLDQKKAEYIDVTLNEAYEDPTLRARLVDFMTKLGLKNDRSVKSYLMNILEGFDRFTPDKRRDYVASYHEKFLSPAFASSLYHDALSYARKSLTDLLRRAYVLDRLSLHYFDEENLDLKKLESAISDQSLWNSSLDEVVLSADTSKEGEEDFLPAAFEDLVSLTKEGDYTLLEAMRKLLEDNGERYFPSQYPGSRKKEPGDASRHVATFAAIKKCKKVLEDALSLSNLSEELKKMTFFEDGIDLLFLLVGRVEKRLDEYRYSHNAFSFADVSSLVLTIFTEKENEDLAEQLRRRFRYVMVDEYQDTNDAQEIFLNGLLKPCADGSRSHLFCVGDAKQSIYAFRGSNVGLFRARQEEYRQGEDGRVIAMNKNYRSAKRLLHDINYIFSFYMTLKQGGIDYLDPMERLTYDDAVNLFKAPLESYGVHRIIPPCADHLQKKAIVERFHDAEYEARAILADIQEKLASGFRVYDAKNQQERPCIKSDFCILVRRKNSVRIYQKLFVENGIPLNNKVSVDLREINAIIFLQSLLAMVGNELGIPDSKYLHHYASLARSYVYCYSDEQLHRILSLDPEARQKALDEDKIIGDLRRFCGKYRDSSFREIFLALLEEFHVIEYLYRIGEVEDNVAKIESLYALLCTGESFGYGLKEFVHLFEDISRRSLSIDSDTVVETSDAVDFMTIHASKGLERKIVYLPSSDNGVGRGSSFGALTLDEDYGILFPYLDYPFDDDPPLEGESSYLTLPLRKKGAATSDEEEQEHVRLLYVALTRAENAVYLVGRDGGKGSAYVMMMGVPSTYHVNPKILASPYVSASLRDAFMKTNAMKPGDPLTLGEEVEPVYSSLREELLLKEIAKAKKDALLALLYEALKGYAKRFDALQGNTDECAKLFAATYFPAERLNVHDLASLEMVFSGESKREEEETQGELPLDHNGSLREALSRFGKGVAELDATLLFPQIELKTEEEKLSLLVDALLLPLARYFDGLDYVFYRSYADESFSYRDLVKVYDDALFVSSSAPFTPKLSEVPTDDTPIEFVAAEHHRASKKARDDELPSSTVLERGSRLHRYLELYRFDGDFSFIPSPKDQAIIRHVSESTLMQLAAAAEERYVEYGYYDEENLTTGYIDMFFVKDGIYHVVDYKTSSIEDPEYEDQLRTYGKAICRLYGVLKEKVRMHLLSILGGKTKDVDWN